MTDLVFCIPVLIECIVFDKTSLYLLRTFSCYGVIARHAFADVVIEMLLGCCLMRLRKFEPLIA